MVEKALYKKISADIIRMLDKGELAPGEKVPSVGDLRDKYKVSHLTALKALKTLALEKNIRFEKGKGYFACERTSRENGRTPKIHGLIACLTRPSWETNDRDNYFNDINQAVENELMKKGFSTLHPWCCHLLMNAFPSDDTLNQIRRKILELNDSVDGFLLDERIPDKEIGRLKDKISKPMVVVNRKSCAGVDSVSPDNFDGARKAAEICLKMGYEKFLVGRMAQAPQNNGERTDGFLSGLRQAGTLEGKIIEFEFNRLPYAEEFGPYEKHLLGPEKTLIFSPSDFFARWAADTLAAQGAEFGKSIGVMGFDAMLMTSSKKPLLATMNARPAQIGVMAAEILTGRINRTDIGEPKNCFPEAGFKTGETI